MMINTVRILIFLVVVVQENSRVFISIILKIILIVINFFDCVDVCFLSFISIIIVSILIVSRFFEESILIIVIFLILFCQHIIVSTKCEIFEKRKKVRLRRKESRILLINWSLSEIATMMCSTALRFVSVIESHMLD